MKLKTVLAAFAAMVTMSVNAQLTNGTVYWLQDTGTGQFLSQGDDWSTKAVTKDVGGLGFEAVYVSDGVYKLNNIMWNTVKNTTLGLGVDVYVDQAPAEWTITASGDGYKIQNGGNYLVNNGSENAYKEKPIGKTTDAAAATVWKFLTKTEYDAAIQAYKDAKAASYANTLGYNGVTTVAALETLINDVNQFISKDYTSSITNPTLGSNDSGWAHGRLGNRGNDAGGWAVGSGCAEFWNGCGYATQTVGNLPNGLYKVTFVGSYRPANSGEANNLASEKASSPAFVYANEAKVEFLHWIDVPAKANGRSGITVANGYQNSFYTYVTNGTLALGVVADGWTDGYSWCTFGQFTLTYYTDQVADEDIAALIAQIPEETAVPADVYSNLTTLKNTLESTKTIADFNALSQAVTAANALVAPYATLVAEVTKAKDLGIDAATADAYLEGVTTAAQATANTQALMVAEYNYVVANYTTAIDLGTWTTENAGTMTSQHWDGTSTTSYNEQLNGWNTTTAWSTSYTQTITLPAGEYVFKVAGRHSDLSVITLSVTEGETVIGTVNDFPIGDTGRGINTSGVTDFSDGGTYARGGAGGGWQWRYVPFTLTAETAVTISVVGSNPSAAIHQWLSFCNYTVQAKPSVAASKAAYEQVKANAETALTSTTYANVGGTDRSDLQGAVDETPTETIVWYDTQTALIEGYLTTFTTGVGNWNNYAKVLVAKAEADLISTDICDGLSLTTPQTDGEAATAVANGEEYTIREATDQYVSATYKYSLTGKIGDFSTWDATAKAGENDDTPQTNDNQHWSNTTRDYYEQGSNGWDSATGFTCTYTKTCTLPAGNYIIKVAARASGDVSGTITATATSNSVVLPAVGASSKGIDTNGAANFGDGTFANSGTGFGWEWRFLPFSITADDTKVTITIQESSTVRYNWFSLADAELLSDEDKTTKITLSDDASDIATTITDNDGELATVTLNRAIKASYNTVCLPFDLTAVQVQALFGAESVVYEYSESSSDPDDVTIQFNSLGAGTITANVPVLVKATAASTENVIAGVTIAAPVAEAKVEGSNFDFVGTYVPMTVAANDYFVGNGAIYKSAGSTNINAFRAYLKVKGGSEVKSVRMFIDGIATAISEINADAAAEEQGAIFNLAGQRVNKAQKGIYVINGKKVLVK